MTDHPDRPPRAMSRRAMLPADQINAGPAWTAVSGPGTPQRRRIAFTDEDAARRFAAGLPGWAAISSDDPEWEPLPGPLRR